MVSFLNNTAVGKALKVLFWVAVSGAVTAVTAFLTNQPDLFNPYVVGIVNVVIVAIKNFADARVPNV